MQLGGVRPETPHKWGGVRALEMETSRREGTRREVYHRAILPPSRTRRMGYHLRAILPPSRTKIKCRLETPDGAWVERIPAWIKWATQVWGVGC